jgi:hypothetical protein
VTTFANIELLRGFGDALNARDIEAILAYCDPNIEFHSGIGAIHGVYHGHDGVHRWHCDNQEVRGEEIRAEPEAVFDLGEHTLTFYVAHGRGQRSGVEVAMPGGGGGEVARRSDHLHQELPRSRGCAARFGRHRGRA